MATKTTWLVLALYLAGSCAWAADRSAEAVVDFEARLEEISREIAEIRRELEAIVNDVAGSDLAKAFVFLEIPSSGW